MQTFRLTADGETGEFAAKVIGAYGFEYIEFERLHYGKARVFAKANSGNEVKLSAKLDD